MEKDTEIELTEQFREEAIATCMSIGLTEDEAEYEVDEYYGY